MVVEETSTESSAAFCSKRFGPSSDEDDRRGAGECEGATGAISDSGCAASYEDGLILCRICGVLWRDAGIVEEMDELEF